MSGASRVIPQPHQGGRMLMEQILRDVRNLQRQALQVDDEGRILIGAVYLWAVQNEDDSVSVMVQNAITESSPVLLARLP